MTYRIKQSIPGSGCTIIRMSKIMTRYVFIRQFTHFSWLRSFGCGHFGQNGIKLNIIRYYNRAAKIHLNVRYNKLNSGKFRYQISFTFNLIWEMYLLKTIFS